MDFRSGDTAKPWGSPSRAEIEVLLPVAKSKNSKIGLGELRELIKYIPPGTTAQSGQWGASEVFSTSVSVPPGLGTFQIPGMSKLFVKWRKPSSASSGANPPFFVI